MCLCASLPTSRYMGIGLSALGVNLNRLPGEWLRPHVNTVMHYVHVHQNILTRSSVIMFSSSCTVHVLAHVCGPNVQDRGTSGGNCSFDQLWWLSWPGRSGTNECGMRCRVITSFTTHTHSHTHTHTRTHTRTHTHTHSHTHAHTHTHTHTHRLGEAVLWLPCRRRVYIQLIWDGADLRPHIHHWGHSGVWSQPCGALHLLHQEWHQPRSVVSELLKHTSSLIVLTALHVL